MELKRGIFFSIFLSEEGAEELQMSRLVPYIKKKILGVGEVEPTSDQRPSPMTGRSYPQQRQYGTRPSVNP